VAFIVLSNRLARSTLASPGRQHPRRWRPRVVIVLVFSDAGPLHDVGRLVQRLTLLAVFFPCRAAVGPAAPDRGQ